MKHLYLQKRKVVCPKDVNIEQIFIRVFVFDTSSYNFMQKVLLVFTCLHKIITSFTSLNIVISKFQVLQASN